MKEFNQEEDDSMQETTCTKQSEWAKQDTIDAYISGNPSKHLFETAEARRPHQWNPRTWRRTVTNYLIDSYTYHRRNVERDSLAECRLLAYKETFEWMYCQLAPKRLAPESIYARGW